MFIMKFDAVIYVHGTVKKKTTKKTNGLGPSSMDSVRLISTDQQESVWVGTRT